MLIPKIDAYEATPLLPLTHTASRLSDKVQYR